MWTSGCFLQCTASLGSKSPQHNLHVLWVPAMAKWTVQKVLTGQENWPDTDRAVGTDWKAGMLQSADRVRQCVASIGKPNQNQIKPIWDHMRSIWGANALWNPYETHMDITMISHGHLSTFFKYSSTLKLNQKSKDHQRPPNNTI